MRGIPLKFVLPESLLKGRGNLQTCVCRLARACAAKQDMISRKGPSSNLVSDPCRFNCSSASHRSLCWQAPNGKETRLSPWRANAEGQGHLGPGIREMLMNGCSEGSRTHARTHASMHTNRLKTSQRQIRDQRTVG